jgi:hypothetical protein
MWKFQQDIKILALVFSTYIAVSGDVVLDRKQKALTGFGFSIMKFKEEV